MGMTQIPITQAAFDAIAGSLPAGWRAQEPQRLQDGRPLIWLPNTLLAKLKTLRAPGEDMSAVILHLARCEGAADE